MFAGRREACDRATKIVEGRHQFDDNPRMCCASAVHFERQSQVACLLLGREDHFLTVTGVPLLSNFRGWPYTILMVRAGSR